MRGLVYGLWCICWTCLVTPLFIWKAHCLSYCVHLFACLCVYHILYVKVWCLKFVVTPLFISKAHSLSSCVHHFIWLCVNHILYMWKCGAWNLWWHHGSFGEHTVEQHGVHILPRRACLIVQLATTKIVADCTLTQRVYIPLPVFVGLCVSLLLLDGVFCVKLMHVYACASVCMCLSIHAL